MADAKYSVKIFVTGEQGPVTKWFATRMERALWLLDNGYSSHRILGHSDPANDSHPSVFWMP